MRSRYFTFVLLVVWLASWGLIYINANLLLLPALSGAVIAILALGRDLRARDHPQAMMALVLPLTRSDEFKNHTTRLERRVRALGDKYKECSRLIGRCTEAHEQMRIPALEAERDAAAREAKRIEDDLRRLRVQWVRDRDERAYCRLTGGR